MRLPSIGPPSHAGWANSGTGVSGSDICHYVAETVDMNHAAFEHVFADFPGADVWKRDRVADDRPEIF